MSEKKKVYFRVASIRTDPTQYKVLAPELEPVKNLVVAMSAPLGSIEEENDETIEMTLEGFITMLTRLSEKIAKVYYDESED